MKQRNSRAFRPSPQRLAPRIGLFLTLAATSLGVSTTAQADNFPTSPISMLIGASAGGGLDYIARSFNQELGEELGQSVIVEYRPGAAGLLAANAAKNAKPDGHTLWIADVGPMSVHPHLYQEANYDAMKEFTHLGMLAQIPLILVVNASVDANTLEEFIELARDSDSLTYGSVGVGNGTHLAMELFKQQNDLQIQHVPYKGVAPAVTDVVGGHIDSMFVDVKTGAPHVKNGSLKPLALAAADRVSALPDVPTFGELGVEGFDVSPWVGLAAPAPLDPAIALKLRDALQTVTHQESVKNRLIEGGFIPLTGTAADMTAAVESDSELWGELINDLGIKIN